jgi:deoxyadenosine/deoxycytidine kinase
MFIKTSIHQNIKKMIISIDGNIGSGKSTLINALRDRMPSWAYRPEPISSWGSLLDRFYENPSRWAFAFNLRVLMCFLDPMVDFSHVVFERSPMATRYVFVQIAYNSGHISRTDFELFKSVYDLVAWNPDVIFYLDVPVETCLQRVQSRGRPCEFDMTEDKLGRIHFQYQQMRKQRSGPPMIIDLDGTKPTSELVDEVLSIIAERTKTSVLPTKPSTCPSTRVLPIA